jgi:hypothetical protein
MDKEIKEWDLDQDWENDDENYEGTEDYQILSSKIRDFNLINQKKSELERMYNTHDLRKESISLPNLQHYGVSLDLFDEIKYKQHLKESFDKIYPLFYLDREQRKFILEKITIRRITQRTKLYSENEDASCAAFILLEGEIYIFKNDFTFLDLINDVSLFGYKKELLLQLNNQEQLLVIFKEEIF